MAMLQVKEPCVGVLFLDSLCLEFRECVIALRNGDVYLLYLSVLCNEWCRSNPLNITSYPMVLLHSFCIIASISSF